MDKKTKEFCDSLGSGWTVYLDKENEPFLFTYWHPELIISKIELKEDKKEVK